MRRGYDDSGIIAQARRALAQDGELSKRQAILAQLPPGKAQVSNLRRIEMKMKRLEASLGAKAGDSEVERRARIAEEHARMFPVGLFEDRDRTCVHVTAPDPGPRFHPDGVTPFVSPKERFVRVVILGIVGGRLHGHCMTYPCRVDAPFEIWRGWDDPYRGDVLPALEELGLSDRVVDGAIVPRTGPSAMVRRLAGELAMRWNDPESPFHPDSASFDDLVHLAIEHEEARLSSACLDRMRHALPVGAMQIAAAASVPHRSYLEDHLADAVENMHRSGIRQVLPFLNPCLHGEMCRPTGAYSGRSRDLVSERFSSSDGLRFDLDDDMPGVAWLLDAFHGRLVAPLDERTMRLLLAYRHRVDLGRVRTDADAAGLAWMVEGLGRTYTWPCTEVPHDVRRKADFLFDRLETGPDGTSAYGEIAASIRQAWDDLTLAVDPWDDGEGRGVVADRGEDPMACLLRTQDALALAERLLLQPALAGIVRDLGLSPRRRDWDIAWRHAGGCVAQAAREMILPGRRLADLVEIGQEAAGLLSSPVAKGNGWASPAEAWKAFDRLLVDRWKGGKEEMARRSVEEFVEVLRNVSGDRTSIVGAVRRLWAA